MVFFRRQTWHIWRSLLHRLAHTDIRVRFAPSPTGHLHLGGLRTALYNYLFAKRNNGKFLLRIEDTDQTRLVPGATERIIGDLRWLGIDIDEGPSIGGNFGSYVQSERLPLYESAIKILLENGSVYHCFCTDRRLELLRKQALRASQVPRYDNKCRHLTAQQLETNLREGKSYCIRFKLNENALPFEDLIYGPVQHNVAETEGDPVIIKTDGYPTYHFANVVDDHYMGITHVLRGVEWQISTPKHILLYNAFGWQPPQFGHLPLLVNSDGSKLSKRQGDIGIEQFRQRGYFAAALVNYVVTAGGGFSKDRANKTTQIYSIHELAKQFDLKRINAHASRLNPLLLDELNRLEIIRQLSDKESNTKLVEKVKQLLLVKYAQHAHNLDLQNEHVEQVLNWTVQRIVCLEDLCSAEWSFLWVKPSQVELRNITTEQWQRLLNLITAIEDFSKEQINVNLKTFSKTEQLPFGQLMKTLRSALSGLKEGPAVAEIMHMLGKQVALHRLSSCGVPKIKTHECLQSKPETI